MAVKNHGNRMEIRLAGEGGQGMILAGIILAEAAAIMTTKCHQTRLRTRGTGWSQHRGVIRMGD
jgi:hypothetical protein